MLTNIIVFILGLSLLIMAHELGHFISAKIFKVYCYEFALGMGPVLLQKKGKETKFSIRAFPIGGFVSMAGESVEDNTEKKDNAEKEEDTQELIELPKTEEEVIDIPFERTINGIAAWKRFIVMAAGVVMNFVLAYFLFFCFLLSVGVVTNANRVNVAQSDNGVSTPFYLAGITSDDIIEAGRTNFTIDGVVVYQGEEKTIQTFEDFNDLVVFTNKGELISYIYQNLTYTLEEEVRVFQFTDFKQELTVHTTKHDTPQRYDVTRTISSLKIVEDEGNLVVVDSSYQRWGFGNYIRDARFGETVKNAFYLEYEGGIAIFKAVGQLFTKEGFQQVGGVVSMYEISGEFQKLGVGYYLYFLGFISINLGVMNLLPIPALDGSQLLIILVEGVTRKKIPAKTKAIINFVGFVFLMALMVVITCKDIINLF